MKKVLAFVMAAALLALCLAGCGAGAASQSAQSAGSAAAQSAAGSDAQSAGDAASADAEAGEALTAIQSSGKLVMMTATGFPPYEYIGEDGQPAGIDIDIAQLVADELGVELEVLDMDFNLLVDSLKSGKGQLVAAGMSVTEERASQIDFSVPYAQDGQCLMVAAGSGIATVKDLAGKTVVVQEATTGHILATDTLGLEPLAFKNAVDCASTIIGGRADAAILDRTTIRTLVSAHPDELELVGEPLTEEQYVLGIAKGNEDFQAVVNKVLQQAIDDGTIEALMDKHLAILAEG